MALYAHWLNEQRLIIVWMVVMLGLTIAVFAGQFRSFWQETEAYMQMDKSACVALLAVFLECLSCVAALLLKVNRIGIANSILLLCIRLYLLWIARSVVCGNFLIAIRVAIGGLIAASNLTSLLIVLVTSFAVGMRLTLVGEEIGQWLCFITLAAVLKTLAGEFFYLPVLSAGATELAFIPKPILSPFVLMEIGKWSTDLAFLAKLHGGDSLSLEINKPIFHARCASRQTSAAA